MTAESPCLKICVMDTASAICAGCGRTIQEIAAWSRLDSAARIQINAALPARMRAMTERDARGQGGPLSSV
jgi:uncharacterized protein